MSRIIVSSSPASRHLPISRRSNQIQPVNGSLPGKVSANYESFNQLNCPATSAGQVMFLRQVLDKHPAAEGGIVPRDFVLSAPQGAGLGRTGNKVKQTIAGTHCHDSVLKSVKQNQQMAGMYKKPAVQLSARQPGLREKWWRRRESNPRPKTGQTGPLHA